MTYEWVWLIGGFLERMLYTDTTKDIEQLIKLLLIPNHLMRTENMHQFPMGKLDVMTVGKSEVSKNK